MRGVLVGILLRYAIGVVCGYLALTGWVPQEKLDAAKALAEQIAQQVLSGCDAALIETGACLDSPEKWIGAIGLFGAVAWGAFRRWQAERRAASPPP